MISFKLVLVRIRDFFVSLRARAYRVDRTLFYAEQVQTETAHIRELLQQIFDVNVRYKGKFHSVISHSTLEQQTPHATVVLCSDSRVDTDVVSDTPAGEMFVVRNIGNQVSTAFGSVEFGVYSLQTQILLIVGHSGCGAVTAAMGNYSSAPLHVQTELATIDIDPEQNLNSNLVRNVNNQVRTAVNSFQDRVQSGQLVVIGMIYDLHNAFNYGNGQLLVVNVNNQTDPSTLAKHQYLYGLQNMIILPKL